MAHKPMYPTEASGGWRKGRGNGKMRAGGLWGPKAVMMLTVAKKTSLYPLVVLIAKGGQR